MLDAERGKPSSHHRKAIAFFDPQLLGAAQRRRTFGAGRRDEEYRELIDRERDEFHGHFDTAQPRRSHRQRRDRLGTLSPLFFHSDVGAHRPQDIEQTGAGGIEPDVLEHEAPLAGDAAGHHKERR